MSVEIFLQEIDQPMLLVHAKTGVIYDQQCAGHSCEARSGEGYLVPMADASGFVNPEEQPITKVISVTEKSRREADLFSALVDALPEVKVFINDDWRRLAFDADRGAETCEAWVPVRVETLPGPATLIWPNSD